MENIGLTAMVSAFARGFHAEHSSLPVYNDTLAKRLLGNRYDEIAMHMAGAAVEHFPDTDNEKALERFVNLQLAPTPLCRAVFCERALETAVNLGVRQYIIFGAGLDSYAYRRPDPLRFIRIIEADLPDMIKTKQLLLTEAGINVPQNTAYIACDVSSTTWADPLRACPLFDAKIESFVSLPGLSYYLTPESFRELIRRLGLLLRKGSALCFDYPNDNEPTARSAYQTALAKGAGEDMKAVYNYFDMECLLADNGFLVYEHMEAHEIDAQFFAPYNKSNPDCPLKSFENVNLCLAVKQT